MESLAALVGSFGWPHVALIFGIICILVFKTQIAGFINRLRSVGREGLKADTLPQVQQEKGPKEEVEKLMKLDESQVLLEQEEFIRKDLAERGLHTEGDTVSILIRHLASTQILLSFEFTYGLIFGSQILILKELSLASGVGLKPERMQQYFESVKSSNPGAFDGWSLDKYLVFLFDQGLIIIQDGNYYITVRGVEFLIWLVKLGRPESKGL